MEVFFKRTFTEDFSNLPTDIQSKVREVCVSIFPALNHLREFTRYPIRKMSGHRDYYRIKIGNFRVGFKLESKNAIFMRVLHRKDIYRSFPH